MKTRLIAVLGAGGVGKTTTAAALAAGLARDGLRTAVITVDPARRLAGVLGLESLGNDPREVFRDANGGSMSALWLDSQTAFEELVRKHAPRAADKVLNHRLFKILQGQLGGVEEYLGVEKVLALGRSGDFDVCVLDTPPSRHALDFLDSPQHLLKFFDESILSYFLQDDAPDTQKGFFARIVRSGRQQALDAFRGFLGKSFLGELANLLQEFRPVQEIFTDRARAIEGWTREESTRFVLVSTFDAYPLDEARLLADELETRGLPGQRLLVLNKTLPNETPPSASELVRALGEEGARALQARWDAERMARSGLAQTFDGRMPPLAEVRRYSVEHLALAQLEAMGRGIVSAWRATSSTAL